MCASHENWDRIGYPDGLEGKEIPLASRIIRACNAFVAMTSQRGSPGDLLSVTSGADAPGQGGQLAVEAVRLLKVRRVTDTVVP